MRRSVATVGAYHGERPLSVCHSFCTTGVSTARVKKVLEVEVRSLRVISVRARRV